MGISGHLRGRTAGRLPGRFGRRLRRLALAQRGPSVDGQRLSANGSAANGFPESESPASEYPAGETAMVATPGCPKATRLDVHRADGVVLDLGRLERELALARWRQVTDPRVAELDGLIALEEDLVAERRRLDQEHLSLTAAAAEATSLTLPTRLANDLRERVRENADALVEVRRRIVQLVAQA
ncbi:MAG: hypothetical protein ACRC35_10685 [Angustibacter sp.]